MTYADIQAARVIPVASRRGTVFAHALASGHLFATQYPLATDRPELFDGSFERRYTLKRTGRAAAGHLFFEGDANIVMRVSGFILLHATCDNVSASAAREELELLAQFLKGDTETTPYSDAYPYPVLRIGNGFLENYQQNLSPFNPDALPFNPDSTPFNNITNGVYTGDGQPHWFKGYFVYEAESMQYDEPVYDELEHISFSFSLRKVPAPTNIVMV